MRILTIHNSYRQAGGEDKVFASETALLRAAGYHVETLILSNIQIDSPLRRLSVAALATYNPSGRRTVQEAIARSRPDLVHVHNFFPLLSPALFDACDEAGIPAVWTLHNFRVACANGTLFRDGEVCEDCLGRMPFPAVRHACYRGSRAASAAVATMIGYHRLASTWQKKVARFIALTDFAKAKFIAAGLPADKIVVKPNFVTRPAEAPSSDRAGAIFVGRLSEEKGAATLISAWHGVDIPLTIIGDGPQRERLEAAAAANVTFTGWLEAPAVAAAMSRAMVVIVPSLWFENYPMTVVEAMALGTPVIASRLGSLEEIVRHGQTGLHFTAGDDEDLARVVRAACSAPDRLREMGRKAREVYERQLAPERNLAMLASIYDAVLDERRASRHPDPSILLPANA